MRYVFIRTENEQKEGRNVAQKTVHHLNNSINGVGK